MKNRYAYIHSFRSLKPDFHFKQSQLIEWVVSAHLRTQEITGAPKGDLNRLRRFAVHESYIKERYTEYGDDGQDWENHEIYSITHNSPYGADINKRNDFYAAVTLKRMSEIYKSQTVGDHLIHVTCTGYIAPSAPQLFFSQKEVSPAITHAYHMGCYASLPAVRLASALSLSDHKSIDVVHNEICSIHLNANNHLPEQVVVQTLFADGHIFYRINQEEKGLRIIGVKEKIIPETAEDMSWIPSPYGMAMTLSRKVPDKIENHILPFVMEMTKEFELDLAHIIKNAIFAIHPGGPRIIEVIRTKLELREDQIQESKNILLHRGNMSSATLPHVWEEIEAKNYPKGTPIVSLAFGPGLTVFGSVFEVI